MRYFFHIRDAQGVVRDEEGTDLPDMAAARIEARISLIDLAIADQKSRVPVVARHIEIADESGQVLAVVPPKE